MATHLEGEVCEWSIGVTPTATTRDLDTSEVIAAAEQIPLERKVELLTGATTWALAAMPELGLRPVVLSDGPIGVRGTGEDGLASAQLPAPSATAATWDEELQRGIARLIAGEAGRKGVDVVLAPVVNLQRSPVGGRHFECLAEDPLLTARLATAYVTGLQEAGVAASVKHFAGNETETERTSYIARIDERTLREVYLAPFEALVAAGAWTVMAAYNGIAIDGVEATATANERLLRGILKDEWGFDGVVVSDWLATRDTDAAASAGLDLVMPGPGGPWGEKLVAAVREGRVPESVIDDKVARILRLAGRVGALAGAEPRDAGPDPDSPEVVAFLREAAARATVVLRNSVRDTAAPRARGILPLDPAEARRIALIGHNAVEPFVQGGGSAFVTPPHVSQPLDALRAAFPDAAVTLHRGGSTTVGAPALAASEVRTPDGDPGILVEQFDDGGACIASTIVPDAAALWLPIHDRATAVRASTHIALDAPGRHTIEIAPVGAHRVRVDGVQIGESTRVVGSEVVLDSSYHNPPAHLVDLDVEEALTVSVEIDAQIVDAEAYGRFVRAHLRHRAPGRSLDEEIADAVVAATAADVAVVVVGTNPETESEGWDRPDLELPGRQNELVRRVAAANPNTIVVVNAGAPVLLPWLDEVAAVLWWWLPGQEAGASLAAVLTGEIEPSGRLPWTLPADMADVPVPHGTPVDGSIRYTEGLDVGHRAWDRRGLTPAREFGYGLGYARWSYDRFAVAAADRGGLLARVDITNRSARDGREVVQVYLSADGSDPDRPVRWLAGFAVADVAAGETATIDILIERRSLQSWSTDASDWITPPGAYRVSVGRSSRDLRLEAVHTVDG
ncbi:beta-glucosidase [Microbacterium sp. cf046]|uniref:beta-glucosidase family protein n=1 Tax=Microbacterium sp. cf046 TaxID=1761803 RepID=UPI0008EBB754|nr:glycoside hydrolase family 3 C-terminal domain-containing protein [Microbacterium sp. cf046]SFS17378.1 beta-glucosidase [Microbacterium sp. cf046]